MTLAPADVGRPLRILLVEDDSDDSLLFEKALARALGPGPELTWTATFESGLELIRDGSFDVHFVDYLLGASSGLELMTRALRDNPRRNFVIVTGHGNEQLAAEARRRGATGFLSKQELSADKLAACIRNSVARQAPPAHAPGDAAMDPATGLLDTAWFLRTARMYVAGRLGAGSHWALLFIDVDNFRYLMEEWGEAVANQTLRGVADTLRANLAETEPAGRFGQCEFCVLATCSGRREAADLAEQIRADIEARTDATASIGVAIEPARIAQLTTLIANASVAAHEATMAGRNRVEIWHPV